MQVFHTFGGNATVYRTLGAQGRRESLTVKPANSDSPAGTQPQSSALPPKQEDGSVQLIIDLVWTSATAAGLTEQHCDSFFFSHCS